MSLRLSQPYPEDGDSKFLWNYGNNLQYNVVLEPENHALMVNLVYLFYNQNIQSPELQNGFMNNQVYITSNSWSKDGEHLHTYVFIKGLSFTLKKHTSTPLFQNSNRGFVH
jgi:hypothetical protein